MKTEVYTWRVSAELKVDLEREARRRKQSLAAVLDLAARDWLAKSARETEDDQEQVRLHAAAEKYIGALEGGLAPSTTVRETVRKRLLSRYGC